MTKEIFIEPTPPQLQKPSHLARAFLCAAALGLPFAGIVSEAAFNPQTAGAEATTTTQPPYCDVILPGGSVESCPPDTAAGPPTTESKPTTPTSITPTTKSNKPNFTPPVTSAKNTKRLTPASSTTTTSPPVSTTLFIPTLSTEVSGNIVESAGQPTDTLANKVKPVAEAGDSSTIPIAAAAGALLIGSAGLAVHRRRRANTHS